MTERPNTPHVDPDAHDARRRTTSRRSALLLLGSAGIGTIAVVCSSSDDKGAGASTTNLAEQEGRSSTSSTGATASTALGGSVTDAIPEETAGPFPGDGSNGVNVLDQEGVVRRDITTSFGAYDGVAVGVPLQLDLTVVQAGTGTPLPGAAVYVWHCDIDGGYSLYSENVENENYLRGVQAADRDGLVSFTSIYPAAYDGRWPHVHFEVYSSEAEATGGGTPVATSQLALPEEVSDAVYTTSGYETSLRNMSRTSLETDMVFRDGADQETPTMTGDVASGYVAALTIPV